MPAQEEWAVAVLIPDPRTKLIGIDGCHDGWVAAVRDGDGVSFEIVRPFSVILERIRGASAIVVVDVPIGLPEGGPRACDLAARELLGPRRSSVFPAPCRDTLSAASFEDACTRETRARGKRVTKQTYAILEKIREVDCCLDPDAQESVREAHPEVTFAFLSGQETGLAHPKKSLEGKELRQRILREALGIPFDVRGARERLGRERVGIDDLLDALACLATAERIQRGRAVTLPKGKVERDGRGLRMEIVA
jgi:predicted RNase H-like nuclease